LWLIGITLSIWDIAVPVTLAQIAYLLALGIGTYGLWRGQQLYHTHRTIHLANLPANWIGKKIVFVADTHFGHVRGLRFAQKLARAITAEQPDLVLIGGDFYDGTPMDYQAIAQAFAQYPSTHGTYFITGNHEEFRDKHPFITAVEQAGMYVLNNERVTLDGITLLGVDYFDSSEPARFDKVMSELTHDQKNGPVILLKHVPDLLTISEHHGVALQLSGHTHRGQTWPFSLVTRWMYHGYDYDLKPFRSMQVYTTSGAGTWGPPQRLGTRGEIAILTLQPASQSERK
jgi:predicted MPP superfamily phosphohydrolase